MTGVAFSQQVETLLGGSRVDREPARTPPDARLRWQPQTMYCLLQDANLHVALSLSSATRAVFETDCDNGLERELTARAETNVLPECGAIKDNAGR